MELYGAYQQTGGQFLIRQNTTPENGLLKAGSGAHRQGLFIGKRRAELRKVLRLPGHGRGRTPGAAGTRCSGEAPADHVEWVAAYKRRSWPKGRDQPAVRFQAVRGSFIERRRSGH